MKHLVFVFAVLAVAGCANDRYVADVGNKASVGQMKTDLSDCKNLVLHQYAHQQSGIGAAAAGGLGGVVAGAVVGLVSTQTGIMRASDIDPAIERCMAERGYTGTSEN